MYNKTFIKIGSTIIVGSSSGYDKGLSYSDDNGKTLNKSNITSGDFWYLTLIGSTVVVCSISDEGLLYSEDNGKTWNQSNINKGYFRHLTVIGSTVTASGNYNDKNRLLYSEDNGHTWSQST